jgi:transposase, IS5 family
MTRAADPQISFADLEFLNQNVKLDPLLQSIADFIDQHAELVDRVRCELERGLKNAATGRQGLTASQVLRSLILQRVKNWDYRELRERIADGYTLRRFADFYSRHVPKHDAFNRAFNRLTPQTLSAINEVIVQAAVDLGLEDGRKLRVDTTVVETDVHHPTDSTLLWDSVRVITRLVGRLDELLAHGVGAFPNRTRRARRRMQEIQRMTPTQRPRRQTRKYRELIVAAEEVVGHARAVLEKTRKVRPIDALNEVAIQSVRREIENYCELGLKVIAQTRRRVLENNPVPNAEKIYSIFEPHTDLIKRGKVQKPLEFGHKVFLAESARGLITQYRVLHGNPVDETQVNSCLKRHAQFFGEPPELFSADRGFYSEQSIKDCHNAGVELACIPQRGGKMTPERERHEKTAAFKKGQRFRAGIEGRISVLFRGRGMKRCLAEGRERFELLVGAAVLANNLLVIAQLLIKKNKRRRARTRV